MSWESKRKIREDRERFHSYYEQSHEKVIMLIEDQKILEKDNARRIEEIIDFLDLTDNYSHGETFSKPVINTVQFVTDVYAVNGGKKRETNTNASRQRLGI